MLSELTVKQVWVLCGRQAVDVKDIEQVIVLPMHITTDSDLGPFGNSNVN